jgi:hypothetical protein
MRIEFGFKAGTVLVLLGKGRLGLRQRAPPFALPA